MPAQKEEIVAAIRGALEEVERLVSSAPDAAWANRAYEAGWNARQLLCHIASTSNVAGFLLAMARNPGASFGGALDQDEFNAQQVALRVSKPVREIADEARGHLERDAGSVRVASDELLASHYRAPWGTEGPLADVIVDSIEEHLMMHLRDLANVLG